MFLVFTHRAGSRSRNGGTDAKLANLEERASAASAGRNTGVCRLLLDLQTPLTCYMLFTLSEALSGNQSCYGKMKYSRKCYGLEHCFWKRDWRSNCSSVFFWSECDLKTFGWIRTVGFALQCCSEKNLIKNQTLPFVLAQVLLLFRKQ